MENGWKSRVDCLLCATLQESKQVFILFGKWEGKVKVKQSNLRPFSLEFHFQRLDQWKVDILAYCIVVRWTFTCQTHA
ncbi:hypothetical protein OUZ56_014098 [Daphnia magna]|uniref:Uncharacterized protein n=1 Tax=Daphnia magna TaxID=35525 RepID=A0ABQ9Z8Z9_9CRUS|nr:hypothetical protein OUZ56_014098 [Daphnia magna]